jgi:flagellar protein FlgJ
VLDPSKLKFVEDAAHASVLAENLTECPAAITLAQAIYESGWGQHAPGNNCFGIKSFNPADNRQLLTTTEYVKSPDEAKKYPELVSVSPLITSGPYHGKYKAVVKDYFRAYSSLTEAFIDHGKLLTTSPRYRTFFLDYLASRDLASFEKALFAIYATDSNYLQVAREILSMSEVYSALNAAALANPKVPA